MRFITTTLASFALAGTMVACSGSNDQSSAATTTDPLSHSTHARTDAGAHGKSDEQNGQGDQHRADAGRGKSDEQHGQGDQHRSDGGRGESDEQHGQGDQHRSDAGDDDQGDNDEHHADAGRDDSDDDGENGGHHADAGRGKHGQSHGKGAGGAGH